MTHVYLMTELSFVIIIYITAIIRSTIDDEHQSELRRVYSSRVAIRNTIDNEKSLGADTYSKNFKQPLAKSKKSTLGICAIEFLLTRSNMSCSKFASFCFYLAELELKNG